VADAARGAKPVFFKVPASIGGSPGDGDGKGRKETNRDQRIVPTVMRGHEVDPRVPPSSSCNEAEYSYSAPNARLAVLSFTSWETLPRERGKTNVYAKGFLPSFGRRQRAHGTAAYAEDATNLPPWSLPPLKTRRDVVDSWHMR